MTHTPSMWGRLWAERPAGIPPVLPHLQVQLLHGAGWIWPFSGYMRQNPQAFSPCSPRTSLVHLAGPAPWRSPQEVSLCQVEGRKEPSEAAPPKLNLPPGHLDPVPHECLPQRRQPGQGPGVVDKHLRWYGLPDLGRPCGSGSRGPTPLLMPPEPPQEGPSPGAQPGTPSTCGSTNPTACPLLSHPPTWLMER